MEGSISLRQWTAVALSAASILALSIIGSKLFILAIAAAPLAMGLSWTAARIAPRKLAWPVLGGLCVLLSVVAGPLAGYFFSAAILGGLALPALFSPRMDEDDCYHLVPLVFAAILAGLFAADSIARDEGAWKEFAQIRAWAIGNAQAMSQKHYHGSRLPAEQAARWEEAGRLLPFRVTGAAAALIGLSFYFGVIGFRRWIQPARGPRRGFIYFRLKAAYIAILIAALGAWSAWIIRPEPWLGHLAYAALFFTGAALFVESISLAVFYAAGSGRPGLGILLGIAAIALLALAPVAAVLCAAVGLVDVWLDFRNLDRMIGGFQQ